MEDVFIKLVNNSEFHTKENNELPELLSISQAAGYLNLAKQTLYGFTSKGKIPHLKRGKKLYFKRSELNKWIHQEESLLDN